MPSAASTPPPSMAAAASTPAVGSLPAAGSISDAASTPLLSVCRLPSRSGSRVAAGCRRKAGRVDADARAAARVRAVAAPVASPPPAPAESGNIDWFTHRPLQTRRSCRGTCRRLPAKPPLRCKPIPFASYAPPPLPIGSTNDDTVITASPMELVASSAAPASRRSRRDVRTIAPIADSVFAANRAVIGNRAGRSHRAKASRGAAVGCDAADGIECCLIACAGRPDSGRARGVDASSATLSPRCSAPNKTGPRRPNGRVSLVLCRHRPSLTRCSTMWCGAVLGTDVGRRRSRHDRKSASRNRGAARPRRDRADQGVHQIVGELARVID